MSSLDGNRMDTDVDEPDYMSAAAGVVLETLGDSTLSELRSSRWWSTRDDNQATATVNEDVLPFAPDADDFAAGMADFLCVNKAAYRDLLTYGGRAHPAPPLYVEATPSPSLPASERVATAVKRAFQDQGEGSTGSTTVTSFKRQKTMRSLDEVRDRPTPLPRNVVSALDSLGRKEYLVLINIQANLAAQGPRLSQVPSDAVSREIQKLIDEILQHLDRGVHCRHPLVADLRKLIKQQTLELQNTLNLRRPPMEPLWIHAGTEDPVSALFALTQMPLRTILYAPN